MKTKPLLITIIWGATFFTVFLAVQLLIKSFSNSNHNFPTMLAMSLLSTLIFLVLLHFLGKKKNTDP
jgi:hypothetical protein